jgi:hypothetical protein
MAKRPYTRAGLLRGNQTLKAHTNRTPQFGGPRPPKMKTNVPEPHLKTSIRGQNAKVPTAPKGARFVRGSGEYNPD